MSVPGVAQAPLAFDANLAPRFDAGGQGQGQNLQPSSTAIIQGSYSAPSPAPAQYTASDGTVYSSAAAAAARNTQIANATAQAIASRNVAVDNAVSGVNNLENSYLDKVTPFVRTYQQGVDSVNTSRANNALNLRRTLSGVGESLRTGERSLGVRLANSNALDSGAAEAGARAYAQAGNKQSQDARNQAALKTGEIDTTATNLNRQKDDTLTSLNQYKNVAVDTLARSLYDQLMGIVTAAQASGASPSIINPMNDKNSISSDALRRLGEIDARSQADLASAQYLTPDQIQARAVQMDQAGMAANPFAVGDIQVTTPQDGAPISQLPILSPFRKDPTQPTAVA